MSSYIRSRVYMRETCPTVDSIFEDLAERIQELVPERLQDELAEHIGRANKEIKDEVTLPFRDALVRCLEEKEEAEGKVEDLESRIED